VRQTQSSEPSASSAPPFATPPPPSGEGVPASHYHASALSSSAPGSYLQKLEQWLQLYLVGKAPPLPPQGREWTLKAAPWVMLFLLLVALPRLLMILGLGAALVPFGTPYAHGLGYLISLVFGLLLVALRGLSLPGLFNRTANGWRLAYYSMLASAASSVLHFNPPGVLFSLLALYLLFQVRNDYR
jgi:hypothetical protein